MGFARSAATAAACALLGAVAGRVAAATREQAAAGRPLRLQAAQITVRGRDVVPGLVAALRVNDRPWSYLGVPAWLAAFVVNFSLIEANRELEPLIGMLRGGAAREVTVGPPRPAVWTVEAPAPAVREPARDGVFHRFVD
ncbi:MAG: hypothetical protein FJ035_06845 [Chloroflexi bacterium]|nr:hypothetical protein [Chloroflexota bacterium]